MTESGFTSSIKAKLPSRIYSWKINCKYANGIPDSWYSGPVSDLWVEYKYVKTLPKNGVKPNLSPLQEKWLKDRHSEGRNVAVIVGSPDGCLIYTNLEWTKHKSLDHIITKQDVIDFITNSVS